MTNLRNINFVQKFYIERYMKVVYDWRVSQNKTHDQPVHMLNSDLYEYWNALNILYR